VENAVGDILSRYRSLEEAFVSITGDVASAAAAA